MRTGQYLDGRLLLQKWRHNNHALAPASCIINIARPLIVNVHHGVEDHFEKVVKAAEPRYSAMYAARRRDSRSLLKISSIRGKL